jgi:hypothetical protein
MQRWISGPTGVRAGNRGIRALERTVLVVVPHMVAGTRLMDVVPLLEADHRVQTVFTVAPNELGEIWHGTEDFVRAQGGMVLPWEQAMQTKFDLILAASPTGVGELIGPLMIMPHGAGALGSRLRYRSVGPDAAPAHCLDQHVLVRRGQLLPSALVLSSESELHDLERSCPQALPVAVVAGDICFDRLTASLPYREHYRAALGVREGEQLVTVTTTWRPESAFGQHSDLFDRLLTQLPRDQYRVAAILHPNIWTVHGAWQVRAWLADSIRAGLMIIPPDEGWRAALVAADWVVGDHGSVTQYAAGATEVPVLLAAFPDHDIRPGSLADIVARSAPRLRLDRPLPPQLATAAAARDPQRQVPIRELITAHPGRAGAILRRTAYRIMELPEPDRPVPVSPVPLPRPIRHRSEQLP